MVAQWRYILPSLFEPRIWTDKLDTALFKKSTAYSWSNSMEKNSRNQGLKQSLLHGLLFDESHRLQRMFFGFNIFKIPSSIHPTRNYQFPFFPVAFTMIMIVPDREEWKKLVSGLYPALLQGEKACDNDIDVMSVSAPLWFSGHT